MRAAQIFGVLVLGAVTAGCSNGLSSGPVILHLQGSPGDKYSYTTDLKVVADLTNLKTGPMTAEVAARLEEMKKGEQTMNMTRTIEMELKDVSGGKFTWQETTKDVRASGTGILAQAAPAAEQDKGKIRTKVFLPNGKPVDPNSLSEGNIAPLIIVFSDKPVKAGDTWTDTEAVSGYTIKTSYKLDKFERVGSYDTAALAVTVDAGEHMKMNQPLRVWVDKATGQPVKMEGNVMATQSGMKMNISVKMNRA